VRDPADLRHPQPISKKRKACRGRTAGRWPALPRPRADDGDPDRRTPSRQELHLKAPRPRRRDTCRLGHSCRADHEGSSEPAERCSVPRSAPMRSCASVPRPPSRFARDPYADGEALRLPQNPGRRRPGRCEGRGPGEREGDRSSARQDGAAL